MNRPGSVGFVVLLILALVTGVYGPIALADTGSASPSVTEPAPTETRSATMVAQADGEPAHYPGNAGLRRDDVRDHRPRERQRDVDLQIRTAVRER